MANTGLNFNGSMCRNNDILINEGKPRNKQQLEQLRNNQKKVTEKFDPAKHKMVKHPTAKNCWIQVNK